MLIGKIDLPNGISITGACSAVGAIMLAINHEFELAMLCLLLATLCDLYDGYFARRILRTEVAAKVGKEMDSLVDVVSFGVAPGVVVFQMGNQTLPEVLIIMFFVSCAVIRLSWFNVFGTAELAGISYFRGLPVTYSGLFIPIAFAAQQAVAGIDGAVLMPSVLLVTGVLYVLNIRIEKPKGSAYHFYSLVILTLSVVLVGLRHH